MTCQSLITHLRIDHSFYPSTRFKLVCAQDCCRRQFSTYSGLKKHLLTVHERNVSESGDASNSGSQSFQANFHKDTTDIGERSVRQSPEAECLEDNGSGLYQEHTKNICASIVNKLQGSGIANSVISTIVSNLEELAMGLHSQVKHEILSILPKDDSIRSTLEERLENFENPFVEFNTETKRMKYFNEKWGIVEPMEVMLGV